MSNNYSIIEIISFGTKLMKKKTKTKEEKKASKSFEKMFSRLLLIFLSWLVLFTLIVIIFYPTQGFSGIKKYGYVEGKYIVYGGNKETHFSIDVLGKNKELKEKESIILFFSPSDGSLIRAIKNDEYKITVYGKFGLIIATSLLGMIAVTGYAGISKNKVGKDFYNFLLESK